MGLASHISLFVGITILVALEPGPGFVKLSAETARNGVRAARRAALGMALGALPHIAIVASGILVLIHNLPGLLTALKVVGFCYLAWQARLLLLERPLDADGPKRTTREMRSSFTSGFFLVLLNPRTPIFYAAYLPLFLTHESAVAMSGQLLLLGVSVSAIFLAIDIVFIAFARRAASALGKSAMLRRVARYLGASLLGLFGLRLLLSRE
jgi:threonine/homoserine/homoserine lactone efflux protein